MPKLPRPTGKEMIAFLKERDFIVMRIRGSHHVLNNESLRTVIPVHGNESLKIGTLHGILRDIHMSSEEFTEAWYSRQQR